MKRVSSKRVVIMIILRFVVEQKSIFIYNIPTGILNVKFVLSYDSKFGVVRFLWCYFIWCVSCTVVILNFLKCVRVSFFFNVGVF